MICSCLLWSILPSLWWSIFETYIECNIGGRYIKCSECARLSLLQHTYQCTRDLCTLFQYHEATMLPLFPIFSKAKVITNELTIQMCLPRNFLFSQGGCNFYSRTGENTVMENGDKLGEDSVLCPIRQWSIFKAGPYWKPFP